MAAALNLVESFSQFARPCPHASYAFVTPNQFLGDNLACKHGGE